MKRFVIHIRPHCILLCIFLLSAGFTVYARQEKNNIYLLDCTGSMKSNGLWQPAREAINATVTTQAAIPGSTFTVIPFGDEPYERIIFDSNDALAKLPAIGEAFDKYVVSAKHTHISDVLIAGFTRCDPNKENKIYLLTDGEPNGGDTDEKVVKAINDWCGNHRNSRLFYVALKTGVVNDRIRNAIADCPDAYIVECRDGVIPQIGDISSVINANIEGLDETHSLSFNIPLEIPLSLECDDSLFTASIPGGKASGGKIPMAIRSRGLSVAELHPLTAPSAPGRPYSFTIKVTSADSRYIIANPVVTVNMADHLQSRLTMLEGDKEADMGNAAWHGSFLWSDESTPGKVAIDLSPEFANAADPKAAISLTVSSADGAPNDFTVIFNGKELGKGERITLTPATKGEARLEIIFDRHAKEGKRYFKIETVASRGIDLLNSWPVDDDVPLTLRARYSIGWNPLKTTLFWTGVGLLALLALWFIALRPIFFPSIKLARIELTGPGSYYASKKTKGARKVVLTSGRRSQGMLSRLFTGEVRYVRASHFSPDIEILPVGGKKKIRLRPLNRGTEAWDISPTAIFNPYEKGTIAHRSRPDKTGIETS